MQAHPHVFVETGLRLVASESGAIQGVEVTWRYDELYSLLVLEDMELDADFDGRLTAAELQVLDGFDLNWVEGFEGDLYAKTAKGALGLGPPERRGTRLHCMIEDPMAICPVLRSIRPYGKGHVTVARSL